MSENETHEGKVIRDIKTRNDVFEGTRYRKQNNVLRMVLFYLSCAMILALASYGGLFFTKSSLHDGVLENDAETMADAINFEKTNRTLLSQMPGLLDEIKKDPNDKYADSMDVVVNSPKIQIDPENLADLLIKGGLAKETPEGLEYVDVEWHTKNWAYSHVSVVLTSKDDPKIQLTLNIAKDGSLLIWRVVGAFMSTDLRDRVIL